MLIASIDSGVCDPTILFLHHFGGSARQWREVISTLSLEHRCIAADMPGFGAASALSRFTVEEMVVDLAAFVQLNYLNRFILVGHSMTGKVSLAFAARQPAGLLGLVLVTPSPPGPEPIEDAARMEMLQNHGTRAGAEELVKKITAHRLPGALHELAVEDNLNASTAGWEAWLKFGSFEDWSERVGRIDVPALVITGEDDPALPTQIQQRLTLPHLSNSRLVEIPFCGHLPPLEAPAVTLALLKEFIRDIGSVEPEGA